MFLSNYCKRLKCSISSFTFLATTRYLLCDRHFDTTKTKRNFDIAEGTKLRFSGDGIAREGFLIVDEILENTAIWLS